MDSYYEARSHSYKPIVPGKQNAGCWEVVSVPEKQMQQKLYLRVGRPELGRIERAYASYNLPTSALDRPLHFLPFDVNCVGLTLI